MITFSWMCCSTAIEALDNNGILHRDISVSNLVLVPTKGSTIRKGFLIDFDSSVIYKQDREKSRDKRAVSVTGPSRY